MMNRNRIIGLIVGSILILASGSNLIATEIDGGDRVWDPSQWGIDSIDTTRNVGFDVSVAIDPDTDETYISYYERDDGDLWLARTGAYFGNCGPSDTWDCQIVDAAGVVGKYSSIAIGGPGPEATLYISYYDEDNGSLKVLEGTVDRATGFLSYTTETVDPGNPGSNILIGTRTAVAIDNAGAAHIAYQVDLVSNVQAVKYAKRVPSGTGNCGEGTAAGAWQCDHVHLDFDIGDYIDIDTDVDGVPSIAFYDAHDTETYPMVATRVASGGSCNNSDQWECVALDFPGYDTGKWVSLAIGEYKMHLAYLNETISVLQHADCVFGGCGPGGYSYLWIDAMGSVDDYSGIDIALESDSTPVIVYQYVDASIPDLKIARKGGGEENCGINFVSYTWRCDTLDTGDSTHFEAVGGLSIAMNAFREATVANREIYRPPFSLGSGRLKVALAPRADRTPDPFYFLDQTGAPMSTVITSDPIVVSGIDDWSSISIVECTGPPCEYSVNNGTWYEESRWVNDGDSVEVRQTSAPTFGTTTDLRLRIGPVFGGTEDTFSVTSVVRHTLSVTLTGDGSGSVTSAPPGIDCPSSACSALFDETEAVVLSPAASAGSHFSGWSGDADCADGTVDMDTDVNCTANFLLDSHSLTITKTGSGSGTVVSIPAGINCGTTCVASFDTGILVTLIPTQAGGSTFTGWSGDADCTDGIVGMDTDVSCTAAFWLDVEIIFFDGFESGNTDSWSATEP